LWNACLRGEWKTVAISLALLAGSSWFVTLSPGEPALWSLDDYKTARRQLVAGDYHRAETRLRRALASMVPPSQVSAGVANGFVESARERLKAGDRAAALAIIERAIRINPADERHRELHRRIAAAAEPAERPH
jgi:tetratricopeptide (TPR) repeat protein